MMMHDKKSFFGNDLEWLRKLRDENFDRFLTHDSSFLKKIFDKIDLSFADTVPAKKNNTKLFDKDLLGEYRLQQKSTLLVFVNGVFDSALSDKVDDTNKVVCMELSLAIEKYQDKLKQCFIDAAVSLQPLATLNLSLMNSGLFLYIPTNVEITEPFHFLFLTTDNAKFFANIHNQITIEKNSKAVFFEEHVSIGKSNHISNIFTNISAEENNNINYFKLQNYNCVGAEVSNLKIQPQKNSKINVQHIINSSVFSRDHIQIDLKHEHVFCKIKGLCNVINNEHCEFHTRINHDVSNCTSVQVVKGVIKDNAFLDFSGRVYVQKNAMKSEAHLTNRNLLLSNSAQVKTSPEMEIYADDVNCSHGATVGQLEEQMLFYLRTRGIDELEAKKLLVDAFVTEVTHDFIKLY